MKKKIVLDQVKPLLTEVSQSNARKTLRGLPVQFPAELYSRDMVELLEAFKMHHRKTALTIPRELEEMANGIFFCDDTLAELAEVAGLGRWDLPHQGIKLDLLPVQSFLVGYPKSYGRKLAYVAICKYYMCWICHGNVARRHSNAVFDKLAYDVEGIASIPNGARFQVQDTEEEEVEFMKGLFSNPLFEELKSASRGSILKNTTIEFKNHVKSLW